MSIRPNNVWTTAGRSATIATHANACARAPPSGGVFGSRRWPADQRFRTRRNSRARPTTPRRPTDSRPSWRPGKTLLQRRSPAPGCERDDVAIGCASGRGEPAYDGKVRRVTANNVPGGVQLAQPFGRHEALRTDEVGLSRRSARASRAREERAGLGSGARAAVVEGGNDRATQRSGSDRLALGLRRPWLPEAAHRTHSA